MYSVEESLERFHLIRNDATAPAASLCVCVLKRHRCEDKRLQRSRGFISFQNASYHALNGQKTNTTNYDKNNIFKKELGQNLIASKNTKKTKQNNNKREQKCTN